MSLSLKNLSPAQRVSRKIRRTIRDLIRFNLQKKVAYSFPCRPAQTNVPFSPHMLVCHQDLLLANCSAKALNLAVGGFLPWVFHDDGSLTVKDGQFLATHFPGCRLVGRGESDAVYQKTQATYPSLFQSRREHVMLLKLADLHVYSEKEKILYVDSDVLFFQKPEFLLQRLNDRSGANYFNRDIASSYIASPEIIRQFLGVDLPENVNAGLSVLNREDIALPKIETTLNKLDINLRSDWNYYGHLIEQTCVAALSVASPNGFKHLPVEYDVSFEKKVDITAVCKHYVGLIRHNYELEGLKFLLNQRNFLERWQTLRG